MQAEQQQRQPPWELKVHAKANNFDFRLKAAIKRLPSAPNLSQFSIKLKHSRFLIKLEGKPKAPSSRKLKIFNFEFCKILERFRIRCGTKKPIRANEGSAFRSPSLVGNLAVLWQRISEKDLKGILVLSRMIFPCLASVFKNLVGRKMTVVLLLALCSTMFSCLILLPML